MFHPSGNRAVQAQFQRGLVLVFRFLPRLPCVTGKATNLKPGAMAGRKLSAVPPFCNAAVAAAAIRSGASSASAAACHASALACSLVERRDFDFLNGLVASNRFKISDRHGTSIRRSSLSPGIAPAEDHGRDIPARGWFAGGCLHRMPTPSDIQPLSLGLPRFGKPPGK